jgi:hypothetical protein
VSDAVPELGSVEETEAQVAELCGIVNATHGRLVSLVAKVIDEGLWQGVGIMSVEHWVTWKCGVSTGRARQICAAARRAGELPDTMALVVSGALTLDQAAVVAKYGPADKDTEIAAQAPNMTVSQLTRVLSKYKFSVDPEPKPAPPVQTRDMSFGADPDAGLWRFRGAVPLDEGGFIEAALVAARDRIFHDADDVESRRDVSWVDALVLMAERSQSEGARERPHSDRHRVLLHLEADPGDVDGVAQLRLHMGSVLPDSMRRYLLCDATITPVIKINGVPVSVGRAQHTVPDRTRRLVEDRDGGCRVPGCPNRRNLQVHHIVHWENQGPTDTHNLLCLCPRHHRLHHKGHLGITGNADDPNGIEFVDRWNRTLDPTGKPTCPGHPPRVAARNAGIPTPDYRHPSGERLDATATWFGDPIPA